MKDSPSVHQLIRKLSDPRIRGTDDENDAAQVLWEVVVAWCRKKKYDSHKHPDWNAEDVAQRVFQNCCNKFHQYRGNSEAEAWGWIHAVVYNAYKDVSKGTNKKGKEAIEAKYTMERFDEQESHRLPRYGHPTAVDKKAISDKKLYQEKRKQ